MVSKRLKVHAKWLPHDIFNDSPESLLRLSIRCIIDNDVVFGDLCLPEEVANVMLIMYRNKNRGFLGEKKLWRFLSQFKQSRVTVASLCGLPVTDEILEMFLKQQSKNLIILDINDCIHLTPTALRLINTTLITDGNNNRCKTSNDELLQSNIEDPKTTHRMCPLQSLIIGSSSQILPECLFDYEAFGNNLFAPSLLLKKLIVHDLMYIDSPPPLDFLITEQMYTSLQYLDLSNYKWFGDVSAFLRFKALTTLILFNCRFDDLSILSKIKSLKHLDISSLSSVYDSPDELLAELVKSLPHLSYFDISGTNLGGRSGSDLLRALSPRHENPFNFLGLYETSNDVAHAHPLPALRVAGDASESQILTACEAYIDRVEVLEKALNSLFQWLSGEMDFCDLNQAAEIVLLSMQRYMHNKHIQSVATGSMFYILKSEPKYVSSVTVRRRIVTTLLDTMNFHKYESLVLRNGFLALSKFNFPEEVLFEFEKLVQLVLHVVLNEEDFTQSFAINVIKLLASELGPEYKILMGDLGAVDVMLAIISNRINVSDCDDVMETAWSTLWSLTDCTPVNCENFLNNNGMENFIKCTEAFSGVIGRRLRYLMTGVLGNIAECKQLRFKLAKSEYIAKLRSLLSTENDQIEITYNIVGVLAHIVSDGAKFWDSHLPEIDRNVILTEMRETISKWKLSTISFVTYRSFEPILRLLMPNIETSEAQYWAIWVLANKTRVSSSKYGPLLISEDAVCIVQKLLTRHDLPAHIKDLCLLTIFQIERWLQNGTLGELMRSDDVHVF